MPEPANLTLFFVATLVLLITPGPAVLYIVARSIDQGRMAGILSTLGVAVGTLFHVAAAALGISALLVSSALAFNVVKYLGAAYLIYLGIRKLLTRQEMHHPEMRAERKLASVFYQGILVNILNPKTGIFFLAFLPQFVDVNKGQVTIQILFLGMLFVVMAVFTDGIYALIAGSIGHRLKSSTGFLRAQRYVTGSVYIGLGLSTALSGSGKNK